MKLLTYLLPYWTVLLDSLTGQPYWTALMPYLIEGISLIEPRLVFIIYNTSKTLNFLIRNARSFTVIAELVYKQVCPKNSTVAVLGTPCNLYI